MHVKAKYWLLAAFYLLSVIFMMLGGIIESNTRFFCGPQPLIL